MNMESIYSYISKKESGMTVACCQSCGEPCLIPADFSGCVFCGECSSKSHSWTGTTEDFIPPLPKPK